MSIDEELKELRAYRQKIEESLVGLSFIVSKGIKHSIEKLKDKDSHKTIWQIYLDSDVIYKSNMKELGLWREVK